MTKETNIHFKVDMKVNGKQQAVDLGMALGDLEEVMESVDKASKNTSGAIASVMTRMEYTINAVQRLQSVMSDLTATYAVQQQAETQLARAMRNTMDATDEQIQSIKDLCSAQQERGVIGDEVQLQAAKALGEQRDSAAPGSPLIFRPATFTDPLDDDTPEPRHYLPTAAVVDLALGTASVTLRQICPASYHPADS